MFCASWDGKGNSGSLSAYEVKNKVRLLERPFKMKNDDGIFLFALAFLVSEIVLFLYYTNWLSDDIISGSPKIQITESTISQEKMDLFYMNMRMACPSLGLCKYRPLLIWH